MAENGKLTDCGGLFYAEGLGHKMSFFLARGWEMDYVVAVGDKSNINLRSIL